MFGIPESIMLTCLYGLPAFLNEYLGLLFIHQFRKYLLNTCFMSRIVSDAGETVARVSVLAFRELAV